MSKLVYIFNGRLPTEKAHGLQISKMCEAFAMQHDINLQMNANATSGIGVELVTPYRYNRIKEDIFEYYGLKNIFVTKKLWSIDPMSIKWFPERLAFWVQSLTSGISITFYLLRCSFPKYTIFYARDYVSLFILSFFGFNPIAEVHDYRFSKPRSFLRFIIKKSRKIVVNSEGTLKTLKAHYEIPASKVLVASNGVDVSFFNIKETKEDARRLLNMPLDKIIVGYIGRLETVGKEKGVSTLINAAIKLTGHEGTVFYIVGGPSELVSKYRNQYSDVRNLVLTGEVQYKKIPLYLRAIDIVVIPLPDDQHAKTTSPIKLFEFLAAGKIIIASDLPALKNYLDEGNALFFKAGDERDLAGKIIKIIDDQNLRKKLAAEAKLDALGYSWSSRADKILNFIAMLKLTK